MLKARDKSVQQRIYCRLDDLWCDARDSAHACLVMAEYVLDEVAYRFHRKTCREGCLCDSIRSVLCLVDEYSVIYKSLVSNCTCFIS